MSETLNVQRREATGTSATKRLRNEGLIPANLYGHGEGNLNLSIPAEEWELIVRNRTRVVTLLGAVEDTAIVNEVQWDTYGIQTLHVDLIRVSADERVETSIRVRLRGEAAGTKVGGVVNHVLHEVQVSSLAISIPEEISISIAKLGVGESLTAGDLPLPANSHMVTPADDVIVVCTAVEEEDDDEASTAIGGEPEVIGRSEEEGDA
jgi:large subunit ribosomal protein L25